jgi:hypothetical protein
MGVLRFSLAGVLSTGKRVSFLSGNPPFILYFAGYFAGGSTGNSVSTIDKYAFPADSRTTLATGLSSNIEDLAGMANSNVAGYFGFNYTVNKFDFSNDSRSSLATGIEFGRTKMAAFANSGVAGYFAGGRTGDTGQSTVRATKYSFPTDSASNITGVSDNDQQLTGMANSGVAGYVAGGNSATSRVSKLLFASDSVSNTTSLPETRRLLTSMANSGVAGYFGGGDNFDFNFDTIIKFAFPSDTRSTISPTLNPWRFLLSGMAHSGTAGYFGGGQLAFGGGRTSIVNKISFPSDTFSTLGTGLSSSRDKMGAMASSGVL